MHKIELEGGKEIVHGGLSSVDVGGKRRAGRPVI